MLLILNQIFKNNTYASFLNSFLGSITTLLITKIFILNDVDFSETAAFYKFLTLISISTLFEAGVTSQFTRVLIYTKNGFNSFKNLKLESFVKESNSFLSLNKNDNVLFNASATFALIVFFILATIACFFSFTLTKVISFGISNVQISFAIVLIFAVVFQNFFIAVLNHVDKVYLSKNIQSLNKVILLFYFIFFDKSLDGYIFGLLISTTLCVSIFLYFTHKLYVIDLKNFRLYFFEIYHHTKKNIFKLILNTLGTYLILRSGMFIAVNYLGDAQISYFGLISQIATICLTIGLIPLNSNIPKISNFYYNNKINLSTTIFFRETRKGLFLLLLIIPSGYIFINVFYGDLIISNAFFAWVLIMMATILEVNHSAAAIFISISDKLPFIKSGIISGIIIVLGAYFLTPLAPSIITLILIRLITQLSYNNWKWPNYLQKKYDKKYIQALFMIKD